MAAAPAHPQPDPALLGATAEPRGRTIILGLFVALAAATALGLWMFSLTPQGSTQKPAIVRALAGDLAIPVVAWFVLHGIAAAGRRRVLWFVLSVPAAAVAYGVGALAFGPLFA